MTTLASIGHSNLFQILNTAVSPTAWTTVAEVGNITPPSFARDAQDATHTESTEGWREFIPGLKDGGEISVELNFVPDTDSTALVLAQFDSDDSHSGSRAVRRRHCRPDRRPRARASRALAWSPASSLRRRLTTR